MSILIGADFVSTESNRTKFENGQVKDLIGWDLMKLFQEADFKVFNLEGPLADERTPIDKKGPGLMAPTAVAAGYASIGVNLLTLANNHIMDQGEKGLKSTMKALDGAGVAFFGAGASLKEASKPYITEINGKRIGFYACAEHEFSIAGEKQPGANPYDPLESFDHVADLAASCDYVIVLYHGGKELYRYPTPWLVKTCRKFVEKGADLVVCQHSHCIGCQEIYTPEGKAKSGTIVYGQGNFLFDNSKKTEWQTGLLIELDDDLKITYHPLTKTGNGVRLAKDKDANVILRRFEARTYDIKKPGFIEEQYAQLVDKQRQVYLMACRGGKESTLFRILNRLTGYRLRKWLLDRKYKKEQLLTLENYIDCEAHRELFLASVRKR